MRRRFQQLPLERQIFYSFSMASVALLLLTLCVALSLELGHQRGHVDSVISGAAEYVAHLEGVAEMLNTGYPDPGVSRELDLLCRSYPELEILAVYDRNGLRFYHTSRRETGDSLLTGEEARILSGAAPYITASYGTQGQQRSAFHAVENAAGEIIGFVTVATFQARVTQRELTLVLIYALILCGALLLALLLSHALVRLLRSSLRGNDPKELLELYLRQDRVLDALEDGLVLTDLRGEIVFANAQAAGLLELGESRGAGRPLADFFPETRCLQAAQLAQSFHNRSLTLGERQILLSELPVAAQGELTGVLSILHDKTELRKLSDQLSGTREMLDTLRLFHHEFQNKLHVILGYLQTGQTEAATRLILNSGLVSSQSIREVADRVRVPSLCSLIVGKMLRASELGVRLSLSRDSSCREEDLLFPAQEQGTILGNLLQNAIDAFAAGEETQAREIQLSLYYRPECNLILCEDTAGGIPPELLGRLWEKGASSKGPGRGLGLYLVGELLRQYGGSAEVESEAGEGTCFTLTFSRPAGEGAA